MTIATLPHNVKLRWIGILLLFALFNLTILLESACIHKAGTTPPTPMEKATAYNAIFAETNQTVESGMEAAASSTLISNAQAAPVIQWCAQVAADHKQITAILAKGSSVSAADYSTIQSLVTQIDLSASQLVSSGGLGVKNPKSQQTFAADIQAVVSAVNKVLALIQPLVVMPTTPTTAIYLWPDRQLLREVNYL